MPGLDWVNGQGDIVGFAPFTDCHGSVVRKATVVSAAQHSADKVEVQIATEDGQLTYLVGGPSAPALTAGCQTSVPPLNSL